MFGKRSVHAHRPHPRVAEPVLMLIDPYPWSAPLEEVRLKKN
jgi:hypothetical protein